MSGDVEITASSLMERMQQVTKTYTTVDNEKVVESISRDLDGECGLVDGNVVFTFADLEHFKFVLSNKRNPTQYDLTVFGQGNFANFFIQAPGHAKWLCGIDDASADELGSHARRLADTIKSEYEVENFPMS